MHYLHAVTHARGLAKRYGQPRTVVQVMRDWDGRTLFHPYFKTLSRMQAWTFCFGCSPLRVVDQETGRLAPVYCPVVTVYPDGSRDIYALSGESFDGWPNSPERAAA